MSSTPQTAGANNCSVTIKTSHRANFLLTCCLYSNASPSQNTEFGKGIILGFLDKSVHLEILWRQTAGNRRLAELRVLMSAVRAQVLTSDRSMSLMCVPSHTTQPGQLKTFGFRGTKTSWLQLVTTQFASVASKKPFGETSASGHHRRIPRSPSRRSTACLAKGGICMFCDASQTARHWKGICSCHITT